MCVSALNFFSALNLFITGRWANIENPKYTPPDPHGSRVSNDHGIFTRPALHFFVNIRYKLRLAAILQLHGFAHMRRVERSLLRACVSFARARTKSVRLFQRHKLLTCALLFLVIDSGKGAVGNENIRGHSGPIQAL